ncbi:PD-(D/E)XK nuclease superfamily protein [Sinosporangium album]|uniref:PD-(D/E)XK nuclease superfamily protein n=1 Tax=Sinosporangium album TaxID=504805 RepID=A0A1G7SX38_9ACTN|nr:PD-(D/E)XK nuclease family protein [Sinosporangium album]SDG27623.1 PD-(D/E)XK nuclease superfamily protein [Sinosporangium album]
MSWTIRSELTGNPDIIRLSASMLDRREGDCREFVAVKARPEVRRRAYERRRYAPYDAFPLGLVMAALDAVEFEEADVDAAVAQALAENRSPVHPGAARWIRHACRTYVETSESLAAELARDGVDLRPERSPRIVQITSPTELRAMTAWGRWYGSPDGHVVEFRRMRTRRPVGAPDGAATVAMAYVAATGGQAVNPRDVYREIPVPVRHESPRAGRVRVVEMGLTDGGAKLLVDLAPEEIKRSYLATVRPVAAGLLAGAGRAPGHDCAECKLRDSCDDLPHLPGLLGLPDRGTHRRTWSMTTARRYQICPAQAQMHELWLPWDDSGNQATRRGLAVHQWLEAAHGRLPARPCSVGDLPPHDAPDLGLAAPLVSRADYREARPYLLRHVEVCPLHGPGLVTDVRPEPKTAVYDPSADVVVLAHPDLLRRVDGRLVYREQKSVAASRGITADNAFDLVPQLALAVCLVADGAFGPGAGLVELEQLSPEQAEVITLDAGDPGVVGAARAVVSRLAAEWHHDTAFAPKPGPWCRICPVSRWCDSADDSGDSPHIVVDGLVIDSRTGEIVKAAPAGGGRASAIVASLTETPEDDIPPF